MISKAVEDEFNHLVTSQKNFFNDHSENVSMYIKRFVERLDTDIPSLNLTDLFKFHVELAALVHDIGKLAIPLEILSKKKTLTNREYQIIQNHTQYGTYYLCNLFKYCKTDEDFDFASVCQNIVLYHHERNNGSGYLQNLKGDTIPLEAKIVAIVDSYDALTSQRCYKQTLTTQEAIQRLLEESSQYDERLLKVFIRSLKE